MRKIIVGVDESPGSADAIALATSLARVSGSALMLANVFPYDQRPSRASSRAFEVYLRHDSQALVERLRSAEADDTVEVRVIPNPSPAHGLHELAEAEAAALVVVGSTHTGRVGRVLPGSTAERLLHGSPCPVAVAPKGYAQRSSHELAMIGCGYDGSSSSRRALEEAGRLVAATGARLRVIRAFTPLAFDTAPGNVPTVAGVGSYNDGLHERAVDELEAAVAGLGAGPEVEGDFHTGDAADILAEASDQLDLLIVGSRGYGPLHAVMVGGVTGRLVREAACPLLVFPRGAGDAEAGSLFAGEAAAQR